jgi:hypothetical protein
MIEINKKKVFSLLVSVFFFWQLNLYKSTAVIPQDRLIEAQNILDEGRQLCNGVKKLYAIN